MLQAPEAFFKSLLQYGFNMQSTKELYYEVLKQYTPYPEDLKWTKEWRCTIYQNSRPIQWFTLLTLHDKYIKTSEVFEQWDTQGKLFLIIKSPDLNLSGAPRSLQDSNRGNDPETYHCWSNNTLSLTSNSSLQSKILCLQEKGDNFGSMLRTMSVTFMM